MSDFREDLRGFQDQMAEINKAALTDKADFDLAKCMRDGGRCLAGDRPARVVCTDAKGVDNPLVVLVTMEQGAFVPPIEDAWFFFEDGRCGKAEDGRSIGALRNLPEYKEVEVTLYEGPGDERRICEFRHPTGLNDAWKPYGPPVKVRFERC